MSRILNVTAEYEPRVETETRVSLLTGEFASFPIKGYQGSITISSQNSDSECGVMMWRIRHCQNPKEVIERQIAILQAMKKDIDEMVEKLNYFSK